MLCKNMKVVKASKGFLKNLTNNSKLKRPKEYLNFL